MNKIMLLSLCMCSCAATSRFRKGEMAQCSTPNLYLIRASNDQIKHAVVAGVHYWNDATGLDLFMYAGDVEIEESKNFILIDMTHIIIDTRYIGYDTKYIKPLPPFIFVDKIVGKYELYAQGNCIVGAHIEINNNITDLNMLQTLVRQNMGYVLGLVNNGILGDLMGRFDDSFQHPLDATESDINEIKRLYAGRSLRLRPR